MKKRSIILASLLVLVTQSYAQTIAGYSFEKYPAPIYTGKKAKLSYASNSTAKMFKTRVTEAYNYKGGEVGFGGSYVLSIWGCGAGCISGAMSMTCLSGKMPLIIWAVMRLVMMRVRMNA